MDNSLCVTEEEEAKEKDRKIAQLESLVEEKDRKIAQLESLVGMLEEDIESLRRSYQ